MSEKQDVFELPQVVAAIEKFEITVEQIYKSELEQGFRFNLLCLIELLENDFVLNFLLGQFAEKEKIKSNDSGINRYYSNIPEKLVNRLSSLFMIITKYCIEGKEAFLSDYFALKLKVPEGFLLFKNEIVGAFSRDVKNMLIDLRVKAELSENKEVSKDYAIYIINGGNNQIVNNSELNNSDIENTNN